MPTPKFLLKHLIDMSSVTFDVYCISVFQESEIEKKLKKLSGKEENEKERKMAQVRAALKEVNQRNRDLGADKILRMLCIYFVVAHVRRAGLYMSLSTVSLCVFMCLHQESERRSGKRRKRRKRRARVRVM